MDDISYLCGISLSTFDEYNNLKVNNPNEHLIDQSLKKTSELGLEAFKKHCFKNIHANEALVRAIDEKQQQETADAKVKDDEKVEKEEPKRAESKESDRSKKSNKKLDKKKSLKSSKSNKSLKSNKSGKSNKSKKSRK